MCSLIRMKLVILLAAFVVVMPTKKLWSEEINADVNDIPLPSMSVLSATEQDQAKTLFESQRQSWLSVQSGTGHFKATLKKIIDGNCISEPNGTFTGTIDFIIEPFNKAQGRQSPVNIRCRIHNDTFRCNFVEVGLFDPNGKWGRWNEDSDVTKIDEAIRPFAQELELFFFPFDFMAKTVQDATWSNKYTLSKDDFYSKRGIAIRKSSEQETADVFRGEEQFLFLLSAGFTDAHYWFSTQNGELRQVDVFLPGMVKSFRYEDYYQKDGSPAKYPRKLIVTIKRGTGKSTTGWEYTVELTELALNTAIASDRFVIPSSASNQKQMQK